MRPLEGGGDEESKRLAYLPLLGLPRPGPEPERILCVPRWAGFGSANGGLQGSDDWERVPRYLLLLLFLLVFLPL